jgi:hypothetical protein
VLGLALALLAVRPSAMLLTVRPVVQPLAARG